ncbi:MULTISPECIES: hypothetical protein [Burkholderia]|uniref:hypothetical protein n=1 Tax=Burkholderia TaxID=32008 RepID=UPI001C329805|nr:MULTISPECIES: hypothetical protein [Burkholderia]CAG2382908.1 hypothetical protein BCCR12632_07205 [Burkholderia cenocepacia]CAG2382914.1 hypothetical protein BCCR75389_07162 [Burkholderia cenocepacia]CAG2382924.1 hypothetical protein BCCR75388_07170 [Burkholderia cenocepacia]CAG2382952.1 hypothetical protein BCCR75384_07196 [Burkholderia cenocepacia]CAG2383036.1 hypothetical protein BCCR75387_07192 [Burkholderia cenocepacia]
MTTPMTAVQQMFLEWCIGYMKFRIADAMSVGLMSLEAERYDALWTMLQKGRYGFLCDDMIETGRRLFPDAPNAPEGSGLDAAYERVCTALDDWLPSFVIPPGQVSFLPDPELPDGEPAA